MQLEKSQAVSIPLYLERMDYLHVLFYSPAPPAIAENPFSDPGSFAIRITLVSCRLNSIGEKNGHAPMSVFDTR
jgi:hypothetical protein